MSEREPSSQYTLFQDCLASQLFAKEPEFNDLSDFASYLAAEAWPVVPERFQKASYEALTRGDLGNLDVDELPLDALSTSFVDTLISYGQAEDTDDAVKFVRKVLGKYAEEATAPPPVWSSTRTKECEICERQVPLTYHHLVPRSVQTKALKKGWHTEAMLNKVAWLCRPCHSVVHRVASNEELAQSYHTVELLLEREDVQRWQRYASKQRFGVKRG
ncbi:hypothetical protein D9611_009682 [Ephemerocybe angulata]|uniref:HNH domain-containing protein n=1 Tax=Ephemerocybe angulata TaxID=980116 RepID=A0A8H5FGN7_9AGAR|nr:hypothetical protein D9611_009682 [Tulosesus angulatus]